MSLKNKKQKLFFEFVCEPVRRKYVVFYAAFPKDLTKLESSKSSAEEKLTRVPSRTKNPLHNKSFNKIVKKFSTVQLEAEAPAPTEVSLWVVIKLTQFI